MFRGGGKKGTSLKKNLGINFFDYFSDILGKCAVMPNGAPPEAYRNLLPDRWTKE